jgi:L-aspartate oxidase
MPSVWGAHVLDRAHARLRAYRARATVLATGGSGKVYLYTSNPDIATGDGVAMAYRAGAAVANLEFVQFHPTCLYHPRARTFLISEAVRGEGARLYTVDGHRFMPALHPLAELAPRDVVARAIDREMKRRGDKYVLLDLRPIGAARIRRRFPNIYRRCRELGHDLTREPLPVVPAAHYQCGGVLTDLEGRTTLPRLFAIGEVGMTGLHGANRLASNSLLEAVVMAHRAADSVLATLERGGRRPPATRPPSTGHRPMPEAATLAHNWEAVRRLMWDMVGIVRTDERLTAAAHELARIRPDIERDYHRYRLSADLVELRNLALVAELIVRSARRRRESRGLHYNLDHPRPSERYRRDTVLVGEPGGGE